MIGTLDHLLKEGGWKSTPQSLQVLQSSLDLLASLSLCPFADSEGASHATHLWVACEVAHSQTPPPLSLQVYDLFVASMVTATAAAAATPKGRVVLSWLCTNRPPALFLPCLLPLAAANTCTFMSLQG